MARNTRTGLTPGQEWIAKALGFLVAALLLGVFVGVGTLVLGGLLAALVWLLSVAPVATVGGLIIVLLLVIAARS